MISQKIYRPEPLFDILPANILKINFCDSSMFLAYGNRMWVVRQKTDNGLTFFILKFYFVFWDFAHIFGQQNGHRVWESMKTITNDREYQAIIKRIDQLLDIVTDDNYNSIPEAVELDFLSTLIEEYDRKHYPIAPPQLSE